MSLKKGEIARSLVSLGCFRVSLTHPFTYGSGLRGPVYCDNRKVFSHPKEREAIFKAMLERVADWSGDFHSIVGIATGGIPFGFALARELDKSFLYVRSVAKGYGRKRCLEGAWKAGERAILVEDLVNQGTALQRACRSLKGEGLHPLACFSLVDYQMERAQKVCREENLEHISLTNLDALLGVVADGLDARELDSIALWRRDPEAWDGEV